MQVDPKYLKYYQGLVRKYDKNGDGMLAPDECQSMTNDPRPADTDGNGLITAEELTIWSTKR